jgi:hypothetical protein
MKQDGESAKYLQILNSMNFSVHPGPAHSSGCFPAPPNHLSDGVSLE